MARRLTEEDFSPVYMDVRKNGADDSTWPKIVLWALEAPLTYSNMQVMITVLQRQDEPYGEWNFTAHLKPNDPTLTTSDEEWQTDKFAENGTISVGGSMTFEECLNKIDTALENLVFENL